MHKESKKLIKPEIKFIKFSTFDVITISGEPMNAKGQNDHNDYGGINTFGGFGGTPGGSIQYALKKKHQHTGIF